MVGEYLLRSIPNDYNYKRYYLDKNVNNLNGLILGNSHAYRGIIAEDFDSMTFNAAYISQSLDIDFLIFDKYQNELKNLEFLIINITYPSLFSSVKTSTESWRVKNYNLYYNFNLDLKPTNYSEVLSNSFNLNWKRLKQYYVNSEVNLIQSSELGSGTKEGSIDLVKSGKIAAERHTKPDLPYFKDYIIRLNEIIKVAKENNVKVIITTTPAYKSYLIELNPHQLNLMNKTLDSIAHSNNNAFRFNLLNDAGFIETDFYDGDHLNSEGAKKFTSAFNSYLKELSD
tara:strand:+ start:5324 stop:6178 length:855 start_codon:yes stop_codon:yes gene_type:complete